MSDPAPRLAPRSAGATVDVELLRVARTEPVAPETAATPRLGDRIRGLVPLRAVRPAATDRRA